MSKHLSTITTVTLSGLASACSADPCTWAWVGENAVEYYNEHCVEDADVDDETGDETDGEPIGTDYWCYTDPNLFNPAYTPKFEYDFCAVASTTPGFLGLYELRSADACVATAQLVKHVNSWSYGVTDDFIGQLNAYCPLENTAHVAGNADPNTDWQLCHNPGPFDPNDPYKQRYLPAIGGILGDYAPSMWPQNATCLHGAAKAGFCLKGLVAVGTNPVWTGNSWNLTADMPAEWTCECTDDSDCQGGAVCEAGWIWDGPVVRPTLCTWDETGTANGVAPEGPVVYDAQDWSDVIVDGTRITITSRFYAAAVLGAGLWNDDQRFDFELDATGESIEATITRCGPDSLCAHLGWTEGLTVVADVEVGEDLAAGESVAIDIVDAIGAVETWTVDVVE